MWSRKALVQRAINFKGQSRIPLWASGAPIDSSDVFTYDLSLPDPDDPKKSEWGFARVKTPEGTWIVPEEPVLPSWKDVDAYEIPAPDLVRRFSGIPEAAKNCDDRYRLCSMGLTGFCVYRALRGAKHSIDDCLIEPERFVELMGKIFEFERCFVDLLARKGFHGVEFTDDWLDRQTTRLTPSLWRKLLKDRYANLFHSVKQVGLDVWMSLSPYCGEFISDLSEIGVNVIRVDSPFQMEISNWGRNNRGKVAFAIRLDEMLRGGTVPAGDLNQLLNCFSLNGNGFVAVLSDKIPARTREKTLAQLKKMSE